jgi:hypothetical protein
VVTALDGGVDGYVDPRSSRIECSDSDRGSVLLDHERFGDVVDAIRLAALDLVTFDDHDGPARTSVAWRVGASSLCHLFIGWSFRANEIDDVMDVMDPAGLLIVDNAGVVGVDVLAGADG